jgi:hypothetical protein
MSKPLYTTTVQVPAVPRVVFYAKNAKAKKGEPSITEVTHRVRRLAIGRADGTNSAEEAHFLRRLDADWKLVWQTRHASLKETFWHAEWEYEVRESDWEKVG